jgi:hypothetical protein
MVEFLKSCVGTWYKGFFLLLIIEKHTSQIYKRHLEGMSHENLKGHNFIK